MKNVISFLIVFTLFGFNTLFGQICSQAAALTCNMTYTSTNAGAAYGNNFDIDDYRTCFPGAEDYDARDRVYVVDIATPRDITINVWLMSSQLNVFVVKGCNGTTAFDCVGNSHNSGSTSEEIEIPNAQGKYYIIVDGRSHEYEGSYLIRVSCDGDDDYTCERASTLICGATYQLSTIGSDNNFGYADLGSCVNGVSQANNPFNAGDKLYEIEVPNGSNLSIAMTGLSKDLDLFLYDKCQNRNGQNPRISPCMASSTNSGSSDEVLTLDNASGTYYLLVDGYNTQQESNFRLTVNCTSCEDETDIDCDDLNFAYMGVDNNRIQYRFAAPNAGTTGTWKVLRSNSGGTATTFAGGRTINVNFTASGKYLVCYEYTKADGCKARCCKTIYIGYPSQCSGIIYGYNSNNQSYLLTLTNRECGLMLETCDPMSPQLMFWHGKTAVLAQHSALALRFLSTWMVHAALVILARLITTAA